MLLPENYPKELLKESIKQTAILTEIKQILLNNGENKLTNTSPAEQRRDAANQ